MAIVVSFRLCTVTKHSIISFVTNLSIIVHSWQHNIVHACEIQTLARVYIYNWQWAQSHCKFNNEFALNFRIGKSICKTVANLYDKVEKYLCKVVQICLPNLQQLWLHKQIRCKFGPSAKLKTHNVQVNANIVC